MSIIINSHLNTF